MPPTFRSARTNDMPSVLIPGNRTGFTEIIARPVSEKLPEIFMPAKMKSSVVASHEFLHGRMARRAVFMEPNFGFGMQKS